MRTDLYRLPRCICRAAMLLALALPAGCSPQPQPQPQPQPATSDPLAEVRALIADASCRSDSECRSIAIGSSACGGPERYLAWSTLRTDAAALQRAAAAYPADRLSAVRRGGALSTCAPLPVPGVRCSSNPGPEQRRHCTLLDAKPGTSAAPDR